jgi:hypothetical protein
MRRKKPKRLFRRRQVDREPRDCQHTCGSQLVIVCKHLCHGTAHEWCAIIDPENPAAEPDWICPDCGTRYPDSISLDDLVFVCADCARKLRERAKAMMN